MIFGMQEFFGNDHVIYSLVRKGFDLGGIYFTVNIYGLGLFCKYHRHMKMLGCHTGNADTGSLHSQDLRNLTVCEQTRPLFSHFIEQINVHLMIQKRIYF